MDPDFRYIRHNLLSFDAWLSDYGVDLDNFCLFSTYKQEMLICGYIDYLKSILSSQRCFS